MPTADGRQPKAHRAFTLVEMLVAMAITLVMMAAVVTLFANVSNSVRNRRATIEMTNQVRHLRNVLQQDLQGATCPGATWQRPDSNHGYVELIEGIYTDLNPTPLVQDLNDDKDFNDAGESKINPSLSPIPRNNLGADANNDGKITAQELEAHYQEVGSLVPGALGDFDDTLMLTVRNEREPFVGRMPTDVDDNDAGDGDPAGFGGWDYESIESPLAEVIWFAIENPAETENPNNFFGEPGMRTIYRRALLIAPWLNPYLPYVQNDGLVHLRGGLAIKPVPGLLRVLPDGDFGPDDLANVLAALIAFQDRYDISARVEWDHNIERWKIVANTLADLTKRENRYGHYGFHYSASGGRSKRSYPYPMVSWGRGYEETDLEFVTDPELGDPTTDARGFAETGPAPLKYIANYGIAPNQNGSGYPATPLVVIPSESDQPATARAMLNEDGAVVRVVFGPVPLWGTRRGEDIMMTGVLGFDLRVYDPGAPLFGVRADPTNANSAIETVLQPSDPGWAVAYQSPDHNSGPNSLIGRTAVAYPLVAQGAYVDMGYQYNRLMLPTAPYFFKTPAFANTSATYPWFFFPRGLSDVHSELLAPGYTVYDTWSFHYENNGVNEDADEVESGAWQLDNGDAVGVAQVDEGTNGLDDYGHYFGVTDIRLGPDDVGERETVPPYDKPLRGVQVLIRTYEMDSRAIRQVRVNQHFLPE